MQILPQHYHRKTQCGYYNPQYNTLNEGFYTYRSQCVEGQTATDEEECHAQAFLGQPYEARCENVRKGEIGVGYHGTDEE